MKRIIIVAILASLVVCQAWARRDSVQYQSAGFVDKRPAHKFIEIMPNITVGEATVLQNYSKVIQGLSDMQMSAGVMTRLGVDVSFALRRFVALGTGLSYQIVNSHYSMSIVDNYNGWINSIYVRNRYWQWYVPLYVQWRFNLGTRIDWTIDTGVYFASGQDGHSNVSGYTSGVNSLGQPIVTHVQESYDYYNNSRSMINGVKDFEYGYRFGTGLRFRNHYSVNFVFGWSIPNLAINHNVLDVEYRHLSGVFQLGYTF